MLIQNDNLNSIQSLSDNRKIKILVLATNYPNNEGGVDLMYIHVRNKYYFLHGCDVVVLNFSAKNGYYYQGIKVLSLFEYRNTLPQFDLLISHAPNIRYHYLFLRKFGKRFNRIIFFFHGHEILKTRLVYPKQYSFMKLNHFKAWFVKDLYDCIKIGILRRYFTNNSKKISFIFVSSWMKNKFEEHVKLDLNNYKWFIIHNSIGHFFQTFSYQQDCIKEYDFITIRNNLDDSKYSIDIVNEYAKANPWAKFLVIGKGCFFDFYPKACNITWLNKTLTHKEIIQKLNISKCAFMPTRCDAQGVMTCEMATYGIPVITSNIDICKELSKVLKNLILVDNFKISNLEQYKEKIQYMYRIGKQRYFFEENTIKKELNIILKNR